MISNVQLALNAYNPDNYIQFEDMQTAEKRSAEDILIEKDLFEKLLSEKSKQTVYLIYQGPDELSTKIRHREISWTRIKKYLHDYHDMTGNDFKKIEREITRWLNS